MAEAALFVLMQISFWIDVDPVDNNTNMQMISGHIASSADLGNHGVTVYGHVGADLITLASMLRIPVTMHNVPAEKVYRPHAWASFGTQDQQAADYAACKQYGPLYR